MEITINGKTSSIDAPLTVDALLQREDVESPDMVSVQLNGEIVERTRFETEQVAEGDRVEFLYFMGGGARSGACKVAHAVAHAMAHAVAHAMAHAVARTMAHAVARATAYAVAPTVAPAPVDTRAIWNLAPIPPSAESAEMAKELGLRTRAIHAGSTPSRNRGATAVPLYHTSSFAFDSAEDLALAFEGRHPGYIYSRITNPTVQAFEQRVSALEGGRGSVATSSGMAAIQALFYALTESGSRVLFARSLFGGTLLFLREIASRSGIDVDFVDMDDGAARRAALDREPRFVFFETLGNPKLDIPAIHESVAEAAERGVPTIIDATLSSPALFDAKRAGAAAVLHSTTKYLSGNGTIIGGIVTDLGTFDWSDHPAEAISDAKGTVGKELALVAALRRQAGLNAGLVMSPFTAYLALLGTETLPLRMRAHVENAGRLARYLRGHAEVRSVRYPGLETDPYHERSDRYFRGGSGALLTFDVGDRERAFAVSNRLELATRATNLGDAKTLVIHPASTIFLDCTEEERRFSGVTDGLLRVSVGIEDPDDLVTDFSRALE